MVVNLQCEMDLPHRTGLLFNLRTVLIYLQCGVVKVKGPFGLDQKAPIHLLPKLQQNCDSMSKPGAQEFSVINALVTKC